MATQRVSVVTIMYVLDVEAHKNYTASVALLEMSGLLGVCMMRHPRFGSVNF